MDDGDQDDDNDGDDKDDGDPQTSRCGLENQGDHSDYFPVTVQQEVVSGGYDR